MIKRIINYFDWMLQETKGSKSVEDIYDSIAENTYDDVVDYKRRVEFTKKALNNLHHKPQRVLDIACGTGATIEAMEFKDSASIIGLDISEKMLSKAKKRFKNFKNIILKKEDFLTVTFPSNSFDLITIEFATRFIPKENEHEFAERLASWLKRDGELVIITMDDPLQKIQRVIGKPFGFPRGSNIDMNMEPYIKELIGNYLTYLETISLSRQVIFLAKALYFKKM